MRQAVKLFKCNFDSFGELDRSAANTHIFKCAHIDMSELVEGTDILYKNAGTLTIRGKTVKHLNFVTNTVKGVSKISDVDMTGKYDIIPKYSIEYNRDSGNYLLCHCQLDNMEVVPEQPADWAWKWREKYYRRLTTNISAGGHTYPIIYAQGIRARVLGNATGWDEPEAWNSNYTYYKYKDDALNPQGFYITDRLLAFGASNVMQHTYGSEFSGDFTTMLMHRTGERYYLPNQYQENYSHRSNLLGWSRYDVDTKNISTPAGATSNYYNYAGTNLANFVTWQADTIINAHTVMISFEYEDTSYTGMLYIRYDANNNPLRAIINAIEDFPDENESLWGVEPPLPSGGEYPGPTSTAGGGGGATYTDTDNGIIVTGINGTLFTGSVSGGFKTYDIDSTTLNQTINAIFDGEYSEKMVAQMTTGVIDCYGLAIPATSAGDVDITVLGETMQIGGNTLSAPIIAQGQNFVDCGSVTLDPFYDSFLDFDPYTTAAIYIPFIGKFEIPINDIVHGSVSLKYRQDNYTGDLVAFVEATGLYKFPSGTDAEYAHPIGEFSGNGKYTLPINVASKNNNSLTAALSAGGKIVGGVAAGMQIGSKFGAYGAAAGVIIGGAVGAVSSMQDLRETNSAPLTGHTVSGMNGSQGWLGHMTPYIAVTRSMYAEPETFGADVGYTSNVSYRVGDISGWTMAKNADVGGIERATEAEKAEILRLLTQGVYV